MFQIQIIIGIYINLIYIGKHRSVQENRDCNGATNIYKIVKGYIKNKERPGYLSNITTGLCRRNLSVVLDDTIEPKLT